MRGNVGRMHATDSAAAKHCDFQQGILPPTNFCNACCETLALSINIS
jgi:hypothetical protein